MSKILNQSSPTADELLRQSVAKLLQSFVNLRKTQDSAVMANPSKNVPTIIVVGAGVAGITAACELSLMGMHVIILEARDRIGGRIHTKVINKNVVELGAQFLHGIKGSKLFSDMVKNKVDIVPMSREQFDIYDEEGKNINVEALMPIVQKIKHDVASMSFQRLSDDMNRFVVKNLEKYSEEIRAVSNLTEEEVKKLLQKMTTHELQKESLFEYKTGIGKTESESNYLISSGFSFYLDRVLEYAKKQGSVEVHLNAEVQKIKHHADYVLVELASGDYVKADGLICTLPLGVLQQGNVQFEPQLPEDKRVAIQKLQMADHEKVIFLFNKVFWPNKSHFIVPQEPESKTWLDIVNLNYFAESTSPILVTSFHKQFDAPNLEIVRELEGYFKKIFGKDFIPPKQSWLTSWHGDPYTKGGYCYHPDGATLDDNSEIARPVGRLCFAGEHTFRGPASVKGAYQSGKEAAQQIIQQLTQILTVAS